MNAGNPLPRTPHLSYFEPDDRRRSAGLFRAFEHVLGRRHIQTIYDRLKAEPFSVAHFFAHALELAQIDVRTNPGAVDAIPRSGPVVFIANHPFGIIDGAVLAGITNARGIPNPHQRADV